MGEVEPREPEQPAADEDPSGDESAWKRVGDAVRRLNQNPKWVEAARRARVRLPGDDRVGDVLSTSQNRPSDLAARQLAEMRARQPGLAGELGLGAVQVWQAFAESQGRGRGEVDVTVVFSDIVGFSTWALEAGDEAAVDLLRAVSEAIEPPVIAHHGDVVKRLGDGMMAAFRDPETAALAALEARDNADAIEIGGYTPQLRTGIHTGRPRRVGGDYLGVDVNIAARLCEAAGPGEILVSDAQLPELEDEGVKLKKRRFSAKGAPKDLSAHCVERAAKGKSSGGCQITDLKGGPMRKFLVLIASVAVIAAVAALPSSAMAKEDCGAVQGETDMVEWGAAVQAKNVSCPNARRVVRACLRDGVLKNGWGVGLRQDNLLFEKADTNKKIYAQLAGGAGPGLEDCVAPE